jgi:hypothetical protein
VRWQVNGKRAQLLQPSIVSISAEVTHICRNIKALFTRAMQTTRGKVGLGIAVLVAVAISAYLRPVGVADLRPVAPSASRPDRREVALKNGWITNCTGPAFSQLPNGEEGSQHSERPVFKVNDQLVLAVPVANLPSASGIDSEPAHCKTVSDLPPAKYLAFAISGKWSAGYKPQDIPTVGTEKQFTPDVVAVRIQPEFDNSTREEKDHRQQMIMGAVQQDSTGTLQLGRVTCFLSKWSAMDTSCFAGSSVSESDFMSVRYGKYAATPFVLVIADYSSIRYGGIHVFWKTWTLDPSHIPDIDETIWKSIDEWNLLNNSTRAREQR